MRDYKMANVKQAFARLVEPSLIAIYGANESRPEVPEQVGSGVLIQHRDRPVLVMAKHVLTGQNFDEDPAEKAVMVDGRWVYIGDSGREVIQSKDLDLVVTCMDELATKKCLSADRITGSASIPKIASIGGYLARDFKRSQVDGVLRPSPLVYSNITTKMPCGKIGLKYPKRHNVTDEGEAVFNPIPRGLSGGPMLDTVALLKGSVLIVGVFTDQRDGLAFGEHGLAIREFLDSM